jgi:hypothetical protein
MIGFVFRRGEINPSSTTNPIIEFQSIFPTKLVSSISHNGGAYSTNAKKRTSYRLLVREPEGKSTRRTKM